MKAVILAGGKGTRIVEETIDKPKPMIEIGGMPIIWHIMKLYSHYDIRDFIICAGYRQDVIKKWFADYFLYSSDMILDFKNSDEIIFKKKSSELWRVTIVDTGLNTQTGGRLKRVKEYLDNETFMLTYGDAVGDVDIEELMSFHNSHGKIGTISIYQYRQDKGVVNVDDSNIVTAFKEKEKSNTDFINIGFMIFEQQIFDYIEGDGTILETELFYKLVEENQLAGYKHKGQWQCMDTLKDKQVLSDLWESGNAFWKIW